MHPRRSALFAFLTLSTATLLAEDFVTDFEAPDYEGSQSGIDVAGQQDWYIPSVGGISGKIFTHADDDLAFPDHPTGGGDQFLGGLRAGNFVRAQHDFDWSSSDEWEIVYDAAAGWRGADGAWNNNLMSFSLQDSTLSQHFVLLAAWPAVIDGTAYRTGYSFWNRDGSQTITNNPPIEFPDSENADESKWNNLQVDHWYRFGTRISFAEHRILEVWITDLHTGETTTVVNPVSWSTGDFYFLAGGENPENTQFSTRPTAFRVFTGGSVDGNASAVDNLSIRPPGGEPCEGFTRGDSDGNEGVDFGDIDCFVASLIGKADWETCGTTHPPEAYVCANDINLDGAVDFGDIDGFVECLINGGCP